MIFFWVVASKIFQTLSPNTSNEVRLCSSLQHEISLLRVNKSFPKKMEVSNVNQSKETIEKLEVIEPEIK